GRLRGQNSAAVPPSVHIQVGGRAVKGQRHMVPGICRDSRSAAEATAQVGTQDVVIAQVEQRAPYAAAIVLLYEHPLSSAVASNIKPQRDGERFADGIEEVGDVHDVVNAIEL